MPPRPDRTAIVWQARRLLREARAASLATEESGQPYASLITPAPAPDLSLLMLLSGLSPHTRHLRENGRCSLMVMGAPTGPNPQTAPRLSVTGVAEAEPDPALKARWVARHPYAAFYADLGDFRLVRVRPNGGQFIGGFASAHRLVEADLTPDPAAVQAMASAEPALIEELNTSGQATLDRIAGSEGWRVSAVDVDGCDLVREEAVMRIAWSHPVAEASEVRTELAILADG